MADLVLGQCCGEGRGTEVRDELLDLLRLPHPDLVAGAAVGELRQHPLEQRTGARPALSLDRGKHMCAHLEDLPQPRTGIGEAESDHVDGCRKAGAADLDDTRQGSLGKIGIFEVGRTASLHGDRQRDGSAGCGDLEEDRLLDLHRRDDGGSAEWFDLVGTADPFRQAFGLRGREHLGDPMAEELVVEHLCPDPHQRFGLFGRSLEHLHGKFPDGRQLFHILVIVVGVVDGGQHGARDLEQHERAFAGRGLFE